jgi:hypothetical protein
MGRAPTSWHRATGCPPRMPSRGTCHERPRRRRLCGALASSPRVPGTPARAAQVPADLAGVAFEFVLLQPRRHVLDALRADGRRDACGVPARAVRVEVLVHLDRHIVVRVGYGGERARVAARLPGWKRGVVSGSLRRREGNLLQAPVQLEPSAMIICEVWPAI